MGLTSMNAILLDLAAALKVPLQHHNGLVLVSLIDFGALVEACERTNVLILGIEGFYTAGANITPDMDFIADYSQLISLSWPQAVQQSAVSARLFLDEIPKDSKMLFALDLRQQQPTIIHQRL
jgi:hypothetical protein